MEKKWTIGALLGTSTAYWRGCTLQAAVRLGIFSVIDEQQISLDKVADLIGGDLRGTEYLLNALSGMGLLSKKDALYSNTPEALSLLCKDSSTYIGHILLHHHHILDGWAQLDTAVTTGQPVTRRSYGEAIERESFLMGMFNLAMGIAPIVAKEIDLSRYHRLLDLGGGPGTYAIHFCLANPALDAVIYDRPTTQSFAAETVAKFGLEERIAFAVGI